MTNSGKIKKIGMLSIHSSPVGDLGTRDTGGMSVYIRELARELGKRGILVDVFTLEQNPLASAMTSLSENVRLIRLKMRSGQPVTKENLFDHLSAVLESFDAFVEKERVTYDLVHSHYWLSGVLGNRIKQLRKWPHVMTFHTLGAVKNRACQQESEPEIRIEQEKQLAAVCDRVIASTRSETEDLQILYQAAEDKVGVVAPGVDLNRFRPLVKRDARQQLGLDGKEQLLLYVGRYVPVKGLDRLLKLMPVLNRRDSGQNRFRLLVVGGDDENEQLISLIRNLNVQNSVDLIGRIAHKLMPAYYSAADLLVVPSHHESFSLAGLEALACGTPVVSGPVGGMPEVVTDQSGYILTKNSDSELAEAIFMIADKQREGRLAADQVRASVKTFTWAGMALRMQKEYGKIRID